MKPEGSLLYLGGEIPQKDYPGVEKKVQPTPTTPSIKLVRGKRYKPAPTTLRSKKGYPINYTYQKDCWRCLKTPHDWRQCKEITNTIRVFCIVCGHQGKPWEQCPTARNKTSKGEHYPPPEEDVRKYLTLQTLVKPMKKAD